MHYFKLLLEGFYIYKHVQSSTKSNINLSILLKWEFAHVMF